MSVDLSKEDHDNSFKQLGQFTTVAKEISVARHFPNFYTQICIFSAAIIMVLLGLCVILP